MRTALMVAEKPSLAQSLAKILSGGQMGTRKGSNSACSIHEFTCRFPPTGETVKFKFTSVCGHVMSLDFQGKYNNWDRVDPVSICVCRPTIKKTTNH
jgi:DNA topoisomerase-3